MESNLLRDKVIVIAGGAGIIGRYFVRGIVENGGVAILADINFDSAKKLAGEISQVSEGRVEAAQLDITSKDSINSLIADLRRRHGRIDAVVNNAYPRNKNYGRKLEKLRLN